MVFKRGQLRYFVAVANEGQITRAAEKLHIAQPALSQAIRNLESQLGVQLLQRHGRGVTLTHAGDVFLEKARLAVDAEREAWRTAESLKRDVEGVIVFGTVGLPPWLSSPQLVEAFTEAHPSIEICLKELPFPSVPVASWLAEVDVAIASVLSPDPDVWVQPLQTEPRVVLVARSQLLAKQSELTVAEVLDETFVRRDPSVDPVWAGTWSLDEHRGGPPSNLSVGLAPSVQGTLAMIASGRAISVCPASQAAPIANAFEGVVAIPLRDARPMVLSLVGREDRRNPLVKALLAVARTLTEDTAEDPVPTPT